MEKTFLTPEVKKTLMEKLGMKNVFEVPTIAKIVVGMAVTEALKDKGSLDKASVQMAIITGQKPATTLARKSISSFKLRKGAPIGLKVTLRGARALDFWTKLVTIVLPRMRDFRGISPRGFDGNGNLNIGFREQSLFPDIDYDKIDKTRGLQVTVVTTAGNKEHAQALLEALGMPFSNDGKKK